MGKHTFILIIAIYLFLTNETIRLEISKKSGFTELMGVAGLLRTPFVGVPFGLIGEATIPLDIARIQPLFGFESRLSNSGSMLRF